MDRLRWWLFARGRWAWRLWERFYLWLHPVTPVRSGSLFSYRRVGAAVELHLDSRALAAMQREPGYSAWKAVHRLRGDLAALAARVEGGDLQAVEGVRATSLLGEAGGVLGFETRPLPHSVRAWFEQWFMAGLDALYHPAGLSRLRGRAVGRWPVEVWMSSADLVRRYGAGGKSSSSTVAR